MLQAPPAGATTEMPLSPSAPIALPAVTQLLTSGAALNASSRYTACGPPPWKATGMSRPIAPDGTISVSYGAALALPVIFAATPPNASVSAATQSTRKSIRTPPMSALHRVVAVFAQ